MFVQNVCVAWHGYEWIGAGELKKRGGGGGGGIEWGMVRMKSKGHQLFDEYGQLLNTKTKNEHSGWITRVEDWTNGGVRDF